MLLAGPQSVGHSWSLRPYVTDGCARVMSLLSVVLRRDERGREQAWTFTVELTNRRQPRDGEMIANL